MAHRHPLKNLALDLGNVLVFYDHFITCRKLSAHSPLTPEEIFVKLYNSAFISRYEEGHLSTENFFLKVVSQLKLDLDFSAFSQCFTDIFTLNVPMIEFLRAHADGCRYWIISNTNPLHFEFIRNQFPELFTMARGVTLSYEVQERKPAAEIYRNFLRGSGFKIEDTLFIDDLARHVDGARTVGIAALQYLHHQEFIDEFNLHYSLSVGESN